jgi:hypothetical protein
MFQFQYCQLINIIVKQVRIYKKYCGIAINLWEKDNVKTFLKYSTVSKLLPFFPYKNVYPPPHYISM